MKRIVSESAAKKRAGHAGMNLTIGIDLGDRFIHYGVLHANGQVIEEGRVGTTRESLTVHFSDLPPVVFAIEAGTHSGWVSRLLERFGHQVLVANTREIPGISHSNSKSDRSDAEKLARYARLDPKLMSPIHHRSEEAQLDLAMIRVRERLVGSPYHAHQRNRGLVKTFGHRLHKCSADYFAQRSRMQLPEALRQALLPLLDQISGLTEQIHRFDQQIEKLAPTKYAETAVLREVNGVGALTAVTFVLTVDDPKRFTKRRDVGCYLGLRPRRCQSEERDPELGITKAGDCYLRKTLVQCAQHIVGPFGQDSRLRRWGLKLAQRGSKNAKKRAIVAVARKLAILLHRLWITKTL